MLIQALAEYAHTYLKAELNDMGFEKKLVPYILEIGADGKLMRIIDRLTEITIRGRTIRRAQLMLAPKSPINRNNGIHPLLGCDAIQYVLGPHHLWTNAHEQRRHQTQNNGFIKLIEGAWKATNDKALFASLQFYGSTDQLQRARKALAERKPRRREIVSIAFKDSFATESTPLTDRPLVHEFWQKHYRLKLSERNIAGSAMCLVSGQIGPVAETHDRIKGVSNLGGHPAGVALMSCDKDSFQSYNWKRNMNSPVSPELATAYVLALNDLLKHGNHRHGRNPGELVSTRTDFGATALLYWTQIPDSHNPIELIDSIRGTRLLSAPVTGTTPTPSATDNTAYLLRVTANGGRLVVRDWSSNSLSEMRRNVKAWFNDIRIADVLHAGKNSKPPSFSDLIRSTSAPNAPETNPVNVGHRLQLLYRALYGLPVSHVLLISALSRLRIARGLERYNTARLGLIRLCLNDLTAPRSPPVAESLDAADNNPDYLYGRLLAVCDDLQYAAQGTVSSTIADRFFSFASNFRRPIAMLNAMRGVYLKKLRRINPPAHFVLGGQLSELTSQLSEHTQLPAMRTLEGQGRFAVGFHHQKAHSQMQAGLRKEERK